ncbi:MAG: 2-C-methyl-D-erythritol 2,4-cyclodiphosphate synthase [Bacteroidales bacterium]|jgi:2-C-methyl-D-erythritol 2,4-cyclodiphosphate synthase|nr:2-C-methyl-D-erythritol 2,4-cyclodiphosphate synthase [Bacteroidales bacterium]MCU0407800.1 2-C-methyl-D-erythritol 2,4-cyclodiphosphate synthase [Bacteroidales bacterium]
MNIRIGQGIDFHKLEKGLDLWLGGVKIPSATGCVAHSDGDVLLHAICDAIFGAAGMNDIGFHFPDNDPAYKNIDSKKLLTETCRLVAGKGFSLINIDSTVCLEKPRISSFTGEMKKAISSVTGLPENCVGIKATTTEKMGFTGRGEGIVALAVVLLSAK